MFRDPVGPFTTAPNEINSLIWRPQAMNFLLSALAMVFGLFIVISPIRASNLWAAGRLVELAPERRVSYLRWYRVFGVVLFLSGLFSVVDGIGFANSP